MRAPGFWHAPPGLAAWLLALAGWVYAAATARRLRKPGQRAGVPVICCGNASAGGSGKTTLALDIGQRLLESGRRVAFITRGHGGSLRGNAQVQGHDATLFGDEALLLAALAPTFAGADRAASARLAVAGGAEVLVLDDGLQNPTLVKDVSLLVIDGAVGFGNGRVIPAGPLREPVAAAAGRCQAAVLIGSDRTGALAALPPGLPVLRAHLRPDARARALAGQRVLAFAGIGRPGKFAETLAEAGVEVVALQPFADHHPYTPGEIDALLAEAARLGVPAVTTPKDAARLAPAQARRVRVAGVALEWETPAEIAQLLDSVA